MRVAQPSRRGFTLASRRGFTLVELLMVILIISMLLAMLTAAVWSAQNSARRAQVILEINNLDMALQQYKDAQGSYPPSNIPGGTNAEQGIASRHLRGAFPSATGLAVPPELNSPAEALVFWLGGFYSDAEADGSMKPVSERERRMAGFSANPINPLVNYTPSSQRTSAYFDFDPTRLSLDDDSDARPVFLPPGLTQPYVYFAATNGRYAYDANGNGSKDAEDYDAGTYAGGTARPYSAGGSAWVNPDSFQIISAGFDEDYGAAATKVFPAGTGYGLGDRDNLTNFYDGALEEAQE